MKQPHDILALLQRRFDSKHRDWLANPETGEWPLAISLAPPSEPEALREAAVVRNWVGAWRSWQGGGELQWVTRHWRVLGTQNLPASVTFADADSVARSIGLLPRWLLAQQRFALLTERWPALRTRLARTFAVLADYPDADFNRLLDLLGWLEANPASGLYLRQLPVAGIDSKWLEGRTGILAELIALLTGSLAGQADLYSLCGLKRLPALIRVRMLDRKLNAQLGGLADFAAAPHDLARLAIQPARVIVVENLQTGLALPPLADTVAIMGLGYGVDVLAQLSWVGNAAVTYWGDIDTHGFAILNRARTAVPGISSLLMDEATLLRFQHLAGEEPAQAGADILPLLTDDEASVYAGLKNQKWGTNLRLEQERLPWPEVEIALATLLL